MPSMIDRRPRAPVLRFSASFAMSRQHLLILLDERILWLRQYSHQCILVELVKRDDDWQTAYEFRNKSVLQQVLRLYFLQDVSDILLAAGLHLGTEANLALAQAALDDLVEAVESTTTDEQDVRRIDLDEFLMRMLAAALRRNRSHRTLEDLQQSLLDTLARYVARDGRILGFAGNLIDLIDIYDTALRPLDIIVSGLSGPSINMFDLASSTSSTFVMPVFMRL